MRVSLTSLWYYRKAIDFHDLTSGTIQTQSQPGEVDVPKKTSLGVL